MKRVSSIVIAALAAVVCLSPATDARELGKMVQRKDGKNVDAVTGQVLDFRLTAEREEGGTVLVKLTIPPGSELQQADHLRLVVRKDKQILLWSQLATRKDDGGALTAGFQIHDSLAKDASVAIAFDGGGKGRPGGMAYHVPLADYVTDRKPPAGQKLD